MGMTEMAEFVGQGDTVNWVVVSTTGMIVKVQDTVVIEVALPVREGSGSEVTVSGSMSAMAWIVPVEFRNMESNWVVVMFGLTSPGQQLPQFGWQPYKEYKLASAVSSHSPKGSLLLGNPWEECIWQYARNSFCDISRT